MLFGQVTRGKLGRLGFVGASLLLLLIWFVVVAAILVVAGVSETIVGGDLDVAQEAVVARFGLPMVIVMLVVGAGLLFANLNVTAKRWRAMGLPGWLVVALASVLTTTLQTAIDEQAASVFGFVVLLVLVLVPNGALAGIGRR